jgi:hypothetical protein
MPSAEGEEATPDDAVVDGAAADVARLVAGILDLVPATTVNAATVNAAAPPVAIAAATPAAPTTTVNTNTVNAAAPPVAIAAATPTTAVENNGATASNAEKNAAAAAVKLMRLYVVMETKTKYDACVACLPHLNGGLLEDANIRCVNGTCPSCGFDKIWSKGLRCCIMSREWNPVKSEWVEKLNPHSVLATDSWTDEVQWRGYESKDKPSVGAYLQELNRQAATAARAPDADGNNYSPASKSKSARNLSLETYHGTIVDYLDHMKKQIQFHIAHRNLVSSEHRSKTDYERNSRLWSVARDQDLSENGTIENFEKAQSEHWQKQQYTLFISIVSFLVNDEWNCIEGRLKKR